MYVIMYIMKDTPYTISEFRTKTKVVLDDSKTHDQWIRRGDDLFRVQYMGTVFDKRLNVGGTPTEKTPTPENVGVSDLLKNNSGATPRDVGDVLADIRVVESEKEEELRYCQDDNFAKEIVKKYDEQLKPLWAEYHALKGAK